MNQTMLIISASVFVFSAIVIYTIVYNRRRNQAVQELAQTHGFDYLGSMKPDRLEGIDRFKLFHIGHSKKILNCLYRKSMESSIHIFDYRYTTGGGQHSHTHWQTVYMFTGAGMNLPAFSIRPEKVFHKIGKSFGFQDIDIPEHQAFSNAYLIRGRDEEAIRSLVDGALVNWFEREKGWALEGAGDMLLIYKPEHRIKIEKLWEYQQYGDEVFRILRVSG